MKKILIAAIIILLPTVSEGQVIKIKAFPKEFNEKFYVSIEFMSSGEVLWQKESDEAVFYRIVIFRSEIYNTLDIEKIRYNSSGALKIDLIKNFDLYSLFKKFKIKGEITDVKFDNWINETTCVLRIQGQKYKLSDIDQRLIIVEKCK